MARVFFTLVFASVLALATMYQASAVQYFVEYKAGNTPGGKIWQQEIGEGFSKSRMELATKWVWSLLRLSNVASHGGAPSTWNTQSVTLVISSDYKGVAVTSNIGQPNAKITFGAQYLEKMKKQRRNINDAFYGVIVHEMTHVWQWHGRTSTPSNELISVIEGIADFARLRAGLIDPDWVEPGEGGPWDGGYGVTAWFFDYIDYYVKRDFVILLNQKLESGYNQNFFQQITGKTVSQLWRAYKHHYNEEL